MPRTFISYRHENDEHCGRVAALAQRLEDAGLDVVLDRFEDERRFKLGGPAEGWNHWSIAQAKEAERVLIIASIGWFDSFATTAASAQTSHGKGAASEARVIHAELSDSKWITRKHRVVFFDAQVKVPLEIRDLHRFDGERDVAALIHWLTDGRGRDHGAAVPQWPAPDEEFQRPFAGYGEQWAVAAEMLAAPEGAQILLISGASGEGKSTFVRALLRYAEKQLGRQSAALADCKGAGLPEVLTVLAGELDSARLLRRFEAAGRVGGPPFVEDLRSINEPLLLLFDGYEQASDDVRAWIERALVQAVRKNEWLRVVVAGQETPPLDELAHLADLVKHVRLDGVPDVKAWRGYCKLKGWSVPPEELREMVRAQGGRPIDIARALNDRFRTPVVSRRGRAPDPNALTLDTILEAAAVPHWFDARVLSVLLARPEHECAAWLAQLGELPEIERSESRGWSVHEARRVPMREQLHRSNPQRFVELSRRAVTAFDGVEPHHMVERLFHQLLIVPEEAVEPFFKLQESWAQSGRPNEKRLLASVASELLRWPGVHQRVNAYGGVAWCNLNESTVPIAQREAVARQAVADFVGCADERGEGETRVTLGRLLGLRGDRAGALAEFRQHKAIMLRLVERDPDNTDWQRDLGVSHSEVGRMLEAQDDRAGALAEFLQYKAIMLRLVERDPDNTDWQRELGVSHSHVGRMLEAQGDRAGALAEFLQCKAIMLRLVERDPDNTDWQRELGVSHSHVGRMLEAQGDRAGALAEFLQCKAIMLRLVERDPDNTDWQRELGVSHSHVGRMLEAQGDRAGALAEFLQCKAIMLRLVERDPDNTDWQREQGVSHNHVGRMLEAQGDRAGALIEFEASRAICRKLVAIDPSNALWKDDLEVVEAWIRSLSSE